MRSGTPLTDQDRWPWLHRIAAVMDEWREARKSGIVTCSALKKAYRAILTGGHPDVALLYMHGSYALIHQRMAARHEHYMPLGLLDSQFATLEEPGPEEHPIVIDITPGAQEMVRTIVRALAAREASDVGT
jgi:carbohydrate kinase (thermoresistant glucokinase family)